MVDYDGRPARGAPPTPVRAAIIILTVVSIVLLVLAVAGFAANLGTTVAGHTSSTTAGPPLLMGILGLYVTRIMRHGRRGGLILGVVLAVILIPVLLGIAVLVLLLVPDESRAWFTPGNWAETK
jgi:Na+/proline symporter